MTQNFLPTINIHSTVAVPAQDIGPREIAGPSTATLELLFVELDFTYHARVDLGCPITLRPVIRSDFPMPVGITAIRWQPHASVVAAGLKDKGLQKGLQIQKHSGEWNPRWPGTDNLIVRRNDVFRAGIETCHATAVDLEKLRDNRQLGRMTFLIENREVSLTF